MPHYKALASAIFCSIAWAVTASAQTATITVDAAKTIRVVDDRQFGLNTPFWDDTFTSALTASYFSQMNTRFMRFGGGSATDEYNWQTNKDIVSGDSWAFNVDQFAAVAGAQNAQALITTNYGSAQPSDAAAYVQYANITKGYGFKYWEIGNECYGTWEYDINTTNGEAAHDGYTYGTRAVQYLKAMRAVDPTIKIGAVIPLGEDSYINGNTTHSVTNPRTNVTHLGFGPVMLSVFKAAGVYPDFLIYHRYEQQPGQENDASLLQDALTWPQDAASLRQEVNDYIGSTAGSGIELLVTENNSVSSNPGKQSVSLVNGLYMADSTANLMETEFNSLVWWAMHNGVGLSTPTAPINLSSSLYGWRMYGDYGVQDQDPSANTVYPTFYVSKLLTHYARGGDTAVTASSSNTLLSAYAVKRQDGSLSLLVINKSPTATYSASIGVSGFTPQANATVYSYGIPQDENSEENASVPATTTGSSWENTLDGWVNQSGQPDTTATNFGLDAPFLYTLGYSTTTGVTNGSTSLSVTTTAADPMNNAVIQNSSAALGTAMSTASSVSLDIYPQVAAGTTVQASIYINGTNIQYALLGTATLNVNAENTVTFPVTAAQQAGILNSLASGDYFQVGININSPVPLTAYLDNFVVTPGPNAPAPAAPTPIAGAASSPDVAVSTISNAGTSFTASFAPYSATVISLQPPVLSPTANSQPQSQAIASGHTVALSFPTSGSPTPTYQWALNGSPVSGATSATLEIRNASAADAGTYTCTASNSSGTLTSNPATLQVVSTSNPGRLINLSCRADVGTGANLIFAGFASGGDGTSGSQSVLVRASGPAIEVAPFNVPGTLPDPQLQIFNSAQAVLDTNNGWGGTAAITSAAASVGAFAWTTPTSHDAALDISLPSGSYTAQVAGQSGDTGVALVEVYDATPSGTYTPSMSRLINLSSRVNVGSGANALFAGFAIGGSTSVTVLIRASGPALAGAPFSIPGTLPDPKLTLFNQSTSAVMATNNGWGGDATIASTAAYVGAFGWSNPSSNDSAILITLPPGVYSAEVAGASGDTGVAIVEVYEVQ